MDTLLTQFNAIDITVIVLVILLGIKGFANGFGREFFGFLGLIGGIFAASRLAEPIAKQIQGYLVNLDNFDMLKLVGFLLVLAVVWATVSMIGNIIVGLSESGSTSFISRLLGFALAGTKYFLIFSLIVVALFRSPLIKDNMTQSLKESALYPTLDRVGSYLIDLPPLRQKDHQ